MFLVPVIDLMQGQVIRGVAGQRENYGPNTSCLVDSADPLETCQALMQSFRPPLIYVADLDGIRTGKIQTECLSSLQNCGGPLAVDAGADHPDKVQRLFDLGIEKIIVGLETLSDLSVTEELIASFGQERILFSLDLHDGKPLGTASAGMHPMHVVSRVVGYGVRQLIVLDLAAVGISRGVPTGELCHNIKGRWPELVVWTGGGVRSLVDLHRLSLYRVDGVMVASALHDGRITPGDWQSFQNLLSDDDTMLMMDA